jgi:hypothetical protein
MLREQNNDRAVFSTNIDANTVAASNAILTPAEAGLLVELVPTSGILVGNLRGSGTKPTKVSWYYGNATAEVEWTPWQTRWIRFYDQSVGEQSHRSTPFSRTTGDITSDNLKAQFINLFRPTGSKRTLALGKKGKATLTFENARIKA